MPHARGAARVAALLDGDARRPIWRRWEPAYGRLAEAQVKWEAAHGRPLDGDVTARRASASRSGRRAAPTSRAIVAIERASFSDPWSVRVVRVGARAAITCACSSPRRRGGAGRGGADASLLGYVVALVVGRRRRDREPRGRTRRRGGEGIGGALLDACSRSGGRAGCARSISRCETRTRPRGALYESRGFAEVGRRRGYYRQPVEDALLLRRELAPT